MRPTVPQGHVARDVRPKYVPLYLALACVLFSVFTIVLCKLYPGSFAKTIEAGCEHGFCIGDSKSECFQHVAALLRQNRVICLTQYEGGDLGVTYAYDQLQSYITILTDWSCWEVRDNSHDYTVKFRNGIVAEIIQTEPFVESIKAWPKDTLQQLKVGKTKAREAITFFAALPAVETMEFKPSCEIVPILESSKRGFEIIEKYDHWNIEFNSFDRLVLNFENGTLLRIRRRRESVLDWFAF